MSNVVAWFQEHGAGVDRGGTGGRSFYTSLGHLNETWQVNRFVVVFLSISHILSFARARQDELFIAHVMGGILWALQSNTTRAFNTTAQVGNTHGSSTQTYVMAFMIAISSSILKFSLWRLSHSLALRAISIVVPLNIILILLEVAVLMGYVA